MKWKDKHTPGPPPSSCSTCRQRKKKCDKTRPSCLRCTTGGYVCLGYEREASVHSRSASTPHHESSVCGSKTSDALIFEAASALGQLVSPVNDPGKSDVSNGNEISAYAASTSHPPRNLIMQTPNYMGGLGNCVTYRLPPTFVPDAYTSGKTTSFIMSQYQCFFNHVFFRPEQAHQELIHGTIVARIRSSKLTHWTMYAGAQIFLTLRQGGKDVDVDRFVPWLDRLSRLSFTIGNDAGLDDLAGRLAGALELTFLKSLTSNRVSTYALLRAIAPLFVQLAFADPNLWPRHPLSNGVSLAHALASSQYEIGRFIFIEMTTSLIFGVPPLVEYDTSEPVLPSDHEHPMEWVHGCPPDFVISIVKINQWRARYPSDGAAIAPWKEIETNTWRWRPTCNHGTDPDSRRLVTRFAAQEGWRHAVLIYLYMGMCGVDSHDPRVQSSVRQISDLYTIISSQFAAGMHLTIPFLLAGICTKDEADRRKFRVVISQLGKSKTWVLKGLDFGLALDHLWHGAAADGRPIVWDDYVNSRKATIEVALRLVVLIGPE
ncbi:Fungal specific transcription factor domain [Ceratobasidium sp. AG-Ba]|nr:Fungal specific transcription factor domain [Ceratobasidium sp. AG-Ba]